MKFFSNRNFWIATGLFFFSLAIGFIGLLSDIPLAVRSTALVVMIISGLFLVLNSKQHVHKDFIDGIEEAGWKELSKKEQNITGLLILAALGITFYFTHHINGSFIFALIVVALSQIAIKIYINSKKSNDRR